MLVKYKDMTWLMDKLSTHSVNRYDTVMQDLVIKMETNELSDGVVPNYIVISFTMAERDNLLEFIDKVNKLEESKGDLDSALVINTNNNIIYTISYCLDDEVKYKISTDIKWLYTAEVVSHVVNGILKKEMECDKSKFMDYIGIYIYLNGLDTRYYNQDEIYNTLVKKYDL